MQVPKQSDAPSIASEILPERMKASTVIVSEVVTGHEPRLQRRRGRLYGIARSNDMAVLNAQVECAGVNTPTKKLMDTFASV